MTDQYIPAEAHDRPEDDTARGPGPLHAFLRPGLSRSPLFQFMKALETMRILVTALSLSIMAGCAQYTDNRGVEVTWQPAVMEEFAVGETTRSDVLKRLGPPSQVITMDEETVLYYLYEKRQGQGLILIVYNRFDVESRYDRAVFFFDGNDRLTEYASHIAPDVEE